MIKKWNNLIIYYNKDYDTIWTMILEMSHENYFISFLEYSNKKTSSLDLNLN